MAHYLFCPGSDLWIQTSYCSLSRGKGFKKKISWLGEGDIKQQLELIFTLMFTCASAALCLCMQWLTAIWKLLRTVLFFVVRTCPASFQVIHVKCQTGSIRPSQEGTPDNPCGRTPWVLLTRRNPLLLPDIRLVRNIFWLEHISTSCHLLVWLA